MASSGKIKSRWLTEAETDRLAKLIQRFFFKSAYIIVLYRSEEFEGFDELKRESLINDLDLEFIDNQFNPEIGVDTDDATSTYSLSNTLRSWFQVTNSSYERPLGGMLKPWSDRNVALFPPLIVETVLDLSTLPEDEELYINTDMISLKKKKEIVLERWLIKLDLNTYDVDASDVDIIYNQVLVLIRCLYSLLDVLPASNITDQNLSKYMKTKLINGSQSITSKGRYGLSRPLIASRHESDIVQSKDLSPVLTPIGSLKLSVSFRKNCNYHIQQKHENTSFAEFEFNKNRSSPKDITNPFNSINLGNIKFRTSSSSINSQNLKRRPSGRSAIFKTGSIASSASPPIHTNTLTTTNSTTVQKIDSSANIHSLSNADRQESSEHFISSNLNKSSYGIKMKNLGSRNNSFETSQGVISNNPNNLFASKARNKAEQTGSIDDDLSNFLRLLDSKPDLRVSNNSSILYEDSLNNFKNIKKQNDIFNDSSSKNHSLLASRSVSPPQPPPLIVDSTIHDSGVQLFLDEKADYKHTFPIGRSSSSTPMQLSIMNNSLLSQKVITIPQESFDHHELPSGRARTTSKGSKDSRDSRGSRDSQGSRISVPLIPGALVASSYSPGSIFGTPNAYNNQSLHSILKATAVSEASMDPVMATSMTKDKSVSPSDNFNTALYSTTSNHSHFSSFSETKFYNSNRFDTSHYSNRPISPTTNNAATSILPNQLGPSGSNSNWNSPPSRAQSLLRSLSIGGGTGPNIPKSRTGSSGSMSGSNQLRSVLQKNLNAEHQRQHSRLSSNSIRHDFDTDISPDELRDMSYGHQVFDSEDDISIIDSTPSKKDPTLVKTVNDKPQRRASIKERRESLSTVLNNMKNIQRRRSSVIGPVALRSKISDFEHGSDDEIHDESPDDDEDDLLFEMTDMNTAKQ